MCSSIFSEKLIKVRSILIFYRGVLIPSLIITLLCWIIAVGLSLTQIQNHEIYHGIFSFFPQSFWTKAITSILIIFFIMKYKNKQLYFYYNLGINKTSLWIWTLFIDYFILVVGFIIAGIYINFFQSYCGG